MNLDLLLSFVKAPQKMADHPVSDLEDMVAEYPYFSAAQMLLLKQYKLQNSSKFNKQLRHAAGVLPDRKQLYRLVEVWPEEVDQALALDAEVDVVPLLTELTQPETEISASVAEPIELAAPLSEVPLQQLEEVQSLGNEVTEEEVEVDATATSPENETEVAVNASEVDEELPELAADLLVATSQSATLSEEPQLEDESLATAPSVLEESEHTDEVVELVAEETLSEMSEAGDELPALEAVEEAEKEEEAAEEQTEELASVSEESVTDLSAEVPAAQPIDIMEEVNPETEIVEEAAATTEMETESLELNQAEPEPVPAVEEWPVMREELLTEEGDSLPSSEQHSFSPTEEADSIEAYVATPEPSSQEPLEKVDPSSIMPTELASRPSQEEDAFIAEAHDRLSWFKFFAGKPLREQSDEVLDQLYQEHMQQDLLRAPEQDQQISAIRAQINRNEEVPTSKALEEEIRRLAYESISDDELPASETLAGIYAAQHDYKKAIRIYQKLILKFPDKMSYFARLIEELRGKG